MGIYHWTLNAFNLTGFLTILPMMTLLVFSQAPIRRMFFDFFLRFHWLLFLMVGVCGVIHGSSGTIIGLILFLVDEVLR